MTGTVEPTPGWNSHKLTAAEASPSFVGLSRLSSCKNLPFSAKLTGLVFFRSGTACIFGGGDRHPAS